MIFEFCHLLCLAASLQAAASPENMQDVGGAFGRGWLEGGTAGGPEPAGEDDLFRWEEGPMGNPLASRYAANEPSRDWLGAERMSTGSNASTNNSTSNNTSNETARLIRYQISQTFRPIHEMDSTLIRAFRHPSCPSRTNKDWQTSFLPRSIMPSARRISASEGSAYEQNMPDANYSPIFKDHYSLNRAAIAAFPVLPLGRLIGERSRLKYK